LASISPGSGILRSSVAIPSGPAVPVATTASFSSSSTPAPGGAFLTITVWAAAIAAPAVRFNAAAIVSSRHSVVMR
jgi:hypothetical protein